MTIQTSHLKAFLQASTRIKPSRLLPILSFIRFSNGTIAKSNSGEFVVYSCPFDGEFLVEERILQNFVNATKAEEMTIKYTDKKVTLSDGKSTISSPNGVTKDRDAAANFADWGTLPGPDTPYEALPASCGDYIQTCAKMLSDDDTARALARHVFIGDGLVGGTDASVALLWDISETPRIMLAKGPAMIVGKLKDIEYAASGNYDFFRSGPLLYGFIKPDMVAWFSLLPLKRKGAYPSFTFQIDELLQFCDLCMAASPAFGGPSRLSRTEAVMNDNEYEVDVKVEITGSGDDIEPIKFAPKWLSKLLRQIPASEVTLHRGPQTIYLEGQGFAGMYREIVF